MTAIFSQLLLRNSGGNMHWSLACLYSGGIPDATKTGVLTKGTLNTCFHNQLKQFTTETNQTRRASFATRVSAIQYYFHPNYDQHLPESSLHKAGHVPKNRKLNAAHQLYTGCIFQTHPSRHGCTDTPIKKKPRLQVTPRRRTNCATRASLVKRKTETKIKVSHASKLMKQVTRNAYSYVSYMSSARRVMRRISLRRWLDAFSHPHG